MNHDLTYWVGQLLEWGTNNNGILVSGCGMDMAFHLADTITYGMYGSKKRAKIKTFKGNGGSCLDWKAIY